MRFTIPPSVEELYGQTDINEEAGCDPGGEECDHIEAGVEAPNLDSAEVLEVFDE